MEFQDLMTTQNNASLMKGAHPVPSKPAKFFRCEKCWKRIIERKENGLWYFAFGRQRNSDGNLSNECPVEIYIYGSIRIKCLRKECGHWNILNFFPFQFFDSSDEKKIEVPKNT
jgi:hypothetical protein